jgi:hypothetical protein
MENTLQNQGDPNVAAKTPVVERLDNYWVDKNKWKAMNGGCAIEGDLVKTLANLAAGVKPAKENLPAMVRSAVERKDAQGRKLEQIWAEKITEGATHVGVLEGVFHFFRGEDILPEDNVPLKIPALPPLLQMRDEEKRLLVEQTHVKEVKFRDDNHFPLFGGRNGAGEASVESGVLPEDSSGEVLLQGGSDVN